MIEGIIRKSINEAVSELGFSVPHFILEHPSDISLGDYASNVALLLSKEARKKPTELAGEIVLNINQNKPKEIERIEIAGPGFINFYLRSEIFTKKISEILKQSDKWGSGDGLKNKKIIIEYTDPNPFKPFHIGHLMSNTIGEAITRLLEMSGAEIFRANYQGDVGLHVAKALWAIEKKDFAVDNPEELGKAYVYGNEQYESSDTAKQEIVEINKKVYAKDKSILEIYKKGRETSLAHFEDLYKLLGTKFDHYFFEGETWEIGKKMVDEGLKKGVFEESDGAIIFRGEKYGLHTRVFITKEGIPTYETKDLGLVSLKRKIFQFDLSVIVTGVEQVEYFKVLFKVVSLLDPELEGKLKHIGHGLMQLSSGKMSSRSGNVVTGEFFIHKVQEEVGKRTKDIQTRDRIAIAAIKYSILKQSSGKNITFDLSQALSFEGVSGPYLQYSYVRASSVLDKAKDMGIKPNIENAVDTAGLIEKLLYRFPKVVKRAGEEYEPHYLVTYLTELASAFSSYYAKERIADADENSSYKVALTKAFQITMKNGLSLLGIQAPERM